MDTQRKASIQRPLRFTPDENAALAAFLDASGQGYQAWAHDSLLSLARSGIEVVGMTVIVDDPPPRKSPVFTPRPKAAAPAPKEPKAAPARPEATSGWTRPPGGW